ncbi:MAG TPA: ABC transporter ATP-binding protein [Steroidobacteraceae bacterium]|nr:ABC transporter ATP-binding protein [Steroidobacteraceae bacterium]
MSISFEQITKRYGGNTVVNDVSLHIGTGEFFVLLGPSGSGKSTLLRAAAGLSDVDHGRILLNDRDVTQVPARERGVGLVFQHYALFRHMTVGENVEFALRVRGVRRGARARRREELLQLVALEGYADRLPGELSGGQQQRVAVARALAHEPPVLLLDEPFGALDAKIRVELRDTIRQVQRRLGMTTLLVTHDQEEAFALADRIGVMHNGRLLETGQATTLYRHPATRFVATFLGAANLFLGENTEHGLQLGSALLGHQSLATAGPPCAEVVTVIRPEDIELAETADRLHSKAFATAHVQSLGFAGNLERVRVQLADPSQLQSAVNASGSIDITRTHAEQLALPLSVGRHVALGVRRYHLLPTPISSFRLVGGDPAQATALREAPLLAQLAGSMQARILDAAEEAAAPGLAVLGASVATLADLRALVPQQAQRLLFLPHDASLPRQVLIHCTNDAAQRATLGLVASVMRHLNAEATLLSLQDSSGPRGDATAAFRRLLDARAQMQELHGLDLRTDVQFGGLSDWVGKLATSTEPLLVVLGLTGTDQQIHEALEGPYRPLFASDSRCAVLLCCTGPAATVGTVAGANLHSESI